MENDLKKKVSMGKVKMLAKGFVSV